MTTQSNACTCEHCNGAPCTCGYQTAAAEPMASCQCGDVCTCGDGCTCSRCQHTDTRLVETR